MTTQSPSGQAALPPNHHAHFPAFAGVGGLIAALTFAVGRTGDADLAIRLTGTGPDDHVVDIGCGAGVAVRRAARSATSVIGIDPAPMMLRVARLLTRRGSSVVDYLGGAAEALPLPDGSATVVWSLASVHHWQDLDAGLEEARRVLAASGRLLAVERCVAPGATGHASHGWTDDQAGAFAERCRAVGFLDPEIGHQQNGRRRVVYVLAHAPGA
jgi:ubiquinone/menaquinone biosynthesis C-methylase UbiE